MTHLNVFLGNLLIRAPINIIESVLNLLLVMDLESSRAGKLHPFIRTIWYFIQLMNRYRVYQMLWSTSVTPALRDVIKCIFLEGSVIAVLRSWVEIVTSAIDFLCFHLYQRFINRLRITLFLGLEKDISDFELFKSEFLLITWWFLSFIHYFLWAAYLSV